MTVLDFFVAINNYLDMPVTYLFLAVALYFTIRLGFPQVRALPHLINFAQKGFKRNHGGSEQSINAFHALFAALGTTIGLGNVIGPSLAIAIGGPGALFWLVIYAFFGSVTKLVEVVYAIKFRRATADGTLLGGPAEYLKNAAPILAYFYSFASIFLFAAWSGIKSQTLAEILAVHSVPEWATGIGLAAMVFIILRGGAQRVGNVASKLVPMMFVLYVVFALYILATHFYLLGSVFKLIFSSIFYPAASVGGFLGATVFAAVREGTYKSVYITESGMGTSAIPHSMSDVKRPIDQGILAMYSVAADTFLCVLSGLLMLITGQWCNGQVSNLMIFNLFKSYLPWFGPALLVAAMTIFILTLVVGNSFNGGQSYASITNFSGMPFYYAFILSILFFSAVSDLRLVWAIADCLMPLVAVPNLIGILILSIKYPHELSLKKY